MNKNKNKGLLISFEGLDRCGKSTQIELFNTYLIENGHDVSIYGALYGTQVVDMIGNIITSHQIEEIDPITEMLLYQAARRELFTKLIKPDLEANKTVILDRFIDSTSVYQGAAKGVKKDIINDLSKYVIEDRFPDITFFLDMKKSTFLERMKDGIDKIEASIIKKYEVLENAFYNLKKQNYTMFLIPENDVESTYKKIVRVFNSFQQGQKNNLDRL